MPLPSSYWSTVIEKCCGTMLQSSVKSFCGLTHMNNFVHRFACALHWDWASKYFSYSAARHCMWCSSYHKLLISFLVVSVLVEDINLRKLNDLELHFKMDHLYSPIYKPVGMILWVFDCIPIWWLFLDTESHSLWVFCVRSFFCFSEFCALSSFVIIALWKRELVALHLLFLECQFPVIVLCLFLTILWVGL